MPRSYRLHDLPPQLPSDLCARLAGVEVATLGHVLHAGLTDPGLRPYLPDRRIAGTAVTLQIAGADSTLLYHAMDRLRPGDVLVIDRAGDTRHACFGGFMAAVARVRKLAGVIVDGAVTDPDAIRAADVPVWGRGVSAMTTKLLNLGGSFNAPVCVGGVAVRPGDAVLADDCGIAVIPADQAQDLTDWGLNEQASEGDWLDRLEAGAALQDLVDVAGMIAARDKEDADA